MDILANIKTFRKEQKNRFASTTHTMEVRDYNKLAPELFKHFEEFHVKRVTYGRNIGKIDLTILK
jgi:hypothetical protein